MVLESLSLYNFRNLKKLEVEFSRKVNLLVGDNAQGKTNVIESIYLLATTKSFRTIRDSEMIRWGQEEALVFGKAGPNEIKVVVTKDTKRVFLNNRKEKKSNIIGSLPIVLFSPESLSIISGSPEKRRKYFDQLLAMISKSYLHDFGRYIRAIKNRNRSLFLIKQGRNIDLSVWDRQVVSLGSRIWLSRVAFSEWANKILNSLGGKIIGSKIRIEYAPFPSTIKTEKEIRRFFELELGKRKGADIEKLVTSFGPHRDDFKIYFDIVNKDKILEKDIGSFGSRGEQRIAALALKLVEVEYIEKMLRERPILLLDDVMSEFDSNNREHVATILPKQQSIVTSTNKEALPKEMLSKTAIFEVKVGEVKKI